MHIQIVGGTVNAAVMAYHCAATGHFVYWQLDDAALLNSLQHRQMILGDHQLSFQLHAQLEAGQITLTPPDMGSNIIVLALSQAQYQHVLQQPGEWMQQADLVINYSHLGLGSTEALQQLGQLQQIVYIPDFLQEGRLIESFVTSNLIVGCRTDDQPSRMLVQEIFRPIFPLAQQYNFMSIRAAEFTKLSISGFLATKVSFINDLSNAAEALGVDIEEVRTAMATDQRIGPQYLYPGCGFGGANLTRDVLTLKQAVQRTGSTTGLLDKIWDINEYQKEIVFRKLWKLFNGELDGKVIAFWGAAFKPNTHSIAQAPIIPILEACWAQGAITQVYDPRALPTLQQRYPDQPLLRIVDSQYNAAKSADALCLITEWKQFYSPDFALLKQLMRNPLLIDGRNIYSPDYVRDQGFVYSGIGR